MNNSRDRIYTDWTPNDRNRSIERREPTQSDWRQRYAYSPSPVVGRKEVGREELRESMPTMSRISVDHADKQRVVDKLAQQVAAMEEKNKELFERYSANDKRSADLLRTSKDENQALLNNLKRLLAKPIITAETLAINPVKDKLVAKYREMNPIQPQLGGNQGQLSETNESGRSTAIENTFIVQELSKMNDCRAWIAALGHSKSLTNTANTK